MEGTYVKNLICKVIDKSESNNWDNAVMEWKIIDCEEDEKCSEICICGKENINICILLKICIMEIFYIR
jgi:hypothetical protein